jgi:hypothetical protein
MNYKAGMRQMVSFEGLMKVFKASSSLLAEKGISSGLTAEHKHSFCHIIINANECKIASSQFWVSNRAN